VRGFWDGTAWSGALLLLEPYVDLFNHRTTAASETGYRREKERQTDRERKRSGWAWSLGQPREATPFLRKKNRERRGRKRRSQTQTPLH
jgi:hypothetical protein